MPRAHRKAKSNQSARNTRSTRSTVSKTYGSEISFETRMIVVILLLLFFYPVGLIFMWLWMKEWPMWLKLLISIPLFLGVLLFFAGMVALGSFLGRTRVDYQREILRERMLQQQELRLNPTASPTIMQTTPVPTYTVAPTTY